MVETSGLSPRPALPPMEPTARPGDDDQRPSQRSVRAEAPKVGETRESRSRSADAPSHKVERFTEFTADAEDRRLAGRALAFLGNRVRGFAEFQRVAAGVGRAASLVQTMDRATGAVSEQLKRIAAVIEEAADPKIDDRRRGSLHDRISAARREINDIARNTRFAGVNVLDNRGEPGVEVREERRPASEPEARPPAPVEDAPPPRPTASLSSADLDIDNIDLDDADDVRDAADRVRRASDKVDKGRERLGDARSELANSAAALKDSLDSRLSDTASARRRAEEVAEVIRSQPSFAALATRNASPVGVLNLLIG